MTMLSPACVDVVIGWSEEESTWKRWEETWNQPGSGGKVPGINLEVMGRCLEARREHCQGKGVGKEVNPLPFEPLGMQEGMGREGGGRERGSEEVRKEHSLHSVQSH